MEVIEYLSRAAVRIELEFLIHGNKINFEAI